MGDDLREDGYTAATEAQRMETEGPTDRELSRLVMTPEQEADYRMMCREKMDTDGSERCRILSALDTCRVERDTQRTRAEAAERQLVGLREAALPHVGSMRFEDATVRALKDALADSEAAGRRVIAEAEERGRQQAKLKHEVDIAEAVERTARRLDRALHAERDDIHRRMRAAEDERGALRAALTEVREAQRAIKSAASETARAREAMTAKWGRGPDEGWGEDAPLEVVEWRAARKRVADAEARLERALDQIERGG